MTTQKREESEQISRADVEKRLATLSEADLNKLEAMAKEYNWCLKHSGRDHLDLLREAMFRTYRGTRKWKAKVDVFRHLDLAMRSIANSWLKKYRNAPLSQCETIQVDDEGNELPWDGKTFGNLLVRGPWVIKEYFRGEGGDPLEYDPDGRGWFPTGDVATIDADGYMQITDRSKDVIKSGGEWISTIDLENLAIGHPAVANAAVIGVPHPKWDERPLLIVVKKPGAEVTKEQLLAFYEGKIAKWWTPDDVQFVDAIPLGATGKILKTKLREQFRDYKLPGA